MCVPIYFGCNIPEAVVPIASIQGEPLRDTAGFCRGCRVHTIRDVARLAGASPATASKVLNNSGSVSAKLTQRVLNAVRALDYHPDNLARSLKTRKSQTLGILIPDVTNPFYTDVIKGVENEARAQGYSLVLCDSSEDPRLEQTNLDMLFARRVDGILLAPTGNYVSLERFTHRSCPLVLFDRFPPGYAGAAVVTDSFGGAYDATRHLLSLGHERIAIVTGRLVLPNAQERLDGFRQALQEAHLPLRSEYLCPGTFQSESGYECGLKLMRLGEPPSAIFSCNNKMTLGLMRALYELYVACPERVSVVGFDDFDWAANFSPRLTTVAQPALEMGRQAVLMLLAQIGSGKGAAGADQNQKVILKAEVRVRDSTAPPYSASRNISK